MTHPTIGERAVPGPIGKTKEFLGMIKFEHTIFALPFAYMTLFLVENGWPRGSVFAWITLAMVSGRTFVMAANRLINAGVDARNPRTRDRALPAGRISVVEVGVFMAVSLALFLVAVYRLSPWAGRLWPIVIVAMSFYPYTKRFTWLSHLALGLVYLMVPAALWAARVFHVLFVAALVLAGAGLGVGFLYYAGLAIAGILLVYEHRLISPADLSKVNVAFFTANGVVSIVLFVLAAADTLVSRA
jgi:4-hydroxybenzoate polyprenyltransferase